MRVQVAFSTGAAPRGLPASMLHRTLAPHNYNFFANPIPSKCLLQSNCFAHNARATATTTKTSVADLFHYLHRLQHCEEVAAVVAQATDHLRQPLIRQMGDKVDDTIKATIMKKCC